MVDYLGASFSTGRAGALLLVEHSNSRVCHMTGQSRTSAAQPLGGVTACFGWAGLDKQRQGVGAPNVGEAVQQSGQRPLSAALGVLAPCRCETQPVVWQ